MDWLWLLLFSLLLHIFETFYLFISPPRSRANRRLVGEGASRCYPFVIAPIIGQGVSLSEMVLAAAAV